VNYYCGRLIILEGEREYWKHKVVKAESSKKADEIALKYAREYWGFDPEDPNPMEDGGFYVFRGEVHVSFMITNTRRTKMEAAKWLLEKAEVVEGDIAHMDIPVEGGDEA